jgi:hypothetical protein
MGGPSADPPIPPASRRDPGVEKFLIDECVSVDLVDVAGRAGHGAYHVAHIGEAGCKDWNVTARPRLRLRHQQCERLSASLCGGGLHAVLVILLPMVGRDL